MHTAEDPEEEPEEVILLHELPLKTWITWVRWWHLTAVALPLVFKKKAFGVIGAYLKRETHAVGVRVARLRTYWSDTGRELNRLKEIKRSLPRADFHTNMMRLWESLKWILGKLKGLRVWTLNTTTHQRTHLFQNHLTLCLNLSFRMGVAVVHHFANALSC